MPMGIDYVLSTAEADAQTTGTGKDNFLDASTLRGKVRNLPYLARHQIYFGHYRFGIHDHLSRPGVYLSLMRAPLERLVSEIKHVSPPREIEVPRAAWRLDWDFRKLSRTTRDGISTISRRGCLPGG